MGLLGSNDDKCVFCKSNIAVFDLSETDKPSFMCWSCIKDVVRFYNRFISLAPGKESGGV